MYNPFKRTRFRALPGRSLKAILVVGIVLTGVVSWQPGSRPWVFRLRLAGLARISARRIRPLSCRAQRPQPLDLRRPRQHTRHLASICP